jgi:hypothetical protein
VRGNPDQPSYYYFHDLEVDASSLAWHLAGCRVIVIIIIYLFIFLFMNMAKHGLLHPVEENAGIS